MDLGAIKKGVLRIYGLIPRLSPITNEASGLEGVVFDRDTSEDYKRELEEATEYFLHHARPITKEVEIELEWHDDRSYLINLLYVHNDEKIKLPFMHVCISPKIISEIEYSRNNVPPCVTQAQGFLNYYYRERGFTDKI